MTHCLSRNAALRASLWTATAILICSFASAIVFAQTTQEPDSQTNALKKFLQTYLGEPYPAFEREAPTSYSTAFVDLKDDGTKEVIVYISGRGWCGTGGCTMLILAPEGPSYKLVTKTTIRRLPIRVLATKSNGWHDIAVVVGGGGILQAYEARLCFDGESYPQNPSVSPARPLGRNAKGAIVISGNSKDEPLYK